MVQNDNQIPLCRSDRDPWWLFKHLFWRIFGRYNHPEDFWWGASDIWVEGSKVKGKFIKLMLCFSIDGLCPLLTVVLFFHFLAMLVRPDLIGFMDVFKPNAITGLMFYGALVVSLGIGIIGAVEAVSRKHKKL